MSKRYNPSLRRLAEKPFRVQGVYAHCDGREFETNKAYATFEEAEHVATVHACNATNMAKGNRFIVFKAVAVVGPTYPAIETTHLEELEDAI